MAKKLIRWHINYIGKSGRHLGIVKAPAGDAKEAVKVAARFFGITDPDRIRRLAAQPEG